MRYSFALLLLSILTGCATSDQRFNDLQTNASASANIVSLSGTIAVTTLPKDRHFLIKSQQITAFPGKYIAYKSNAEGTFYAAENPLILERGETVAGVKTSLAHRGGLWIPFAGRSAPRLFVFLNQNVKLKDTDSMPETLSAETLAAYDPASTKLVTNSLVATQVAQTNLSSGQAGMAGAVAGGVMAALLEGQELIFVGSDITDPKAVGQIRAAIVSTVEK